MPVNNADLTPSEILADYYTQYYASYNLADGTQVYAYINEDGTFVVNYNTNTTYYSAFGSDNQTWFQNKYVNPMFGYHYELDAADAKASYYRVVLTNGVNKYYPAPNATQVTYLDGSYLVTDYKSNSYYFSYENSDPNYVDYYYNSSDYNLAWVSSFKPYDVIQTITSDNKCTYIVTSYNDYSAA